MKCSLVKQINVLAIFYYKIRFIIIMRNQQLAPMFLYLHICSKLNLFKEIPLQLYIKTSYDLSLKFQVGLCAGMMAGVIDIGATWYGFNKHLCFMLLYSSPIATLASTFRLGSLQMNSFKEVVNGLTIVIHRVRYSTV